MADADAQPVAKSDGDAKPESHGQPVAESFTQPDCIAQPFAESIALAGTRVGSAHGDQTRRREPQRRDAAR